MKRQTLHLRLMLGSAALSGLLLAACAQAEPGDGTSPSPSASPTAVISNPVKVSPSPMVPPPQDETVIVIGMVERSSLEGGCTVLRTTDNKAYELKGDSRLFPAGSRMKIRGIVRTDLVSICQVGPILEVQSSEPA